MRSRPHDDASAPLVLVHGYLGGAEQWRAEVAALSGRRRLVTVDLPGFGGAADEPAPETIGGFAAAVLARIDALGLGRFALLGHSMGGMIAQEVARRAPGRVERLALYGTGPLGRMPDRFEPLEVSMERLSREGVSVTAERIASTWLVAGESHPAFPMLRAIGARASLPAAASALRAMAAWDGRGALAALAMPTLIVWGEKDRSYRWAQIETLWTGLPDASLAVVPGAAHAVHIEKPGIFHAILDDWLGA